MPKFYDNNCIDLPYTSDDPIGLCNVVVPYLYSGVFAAFVLLTGAIAHLYHIYKLYSIGFKKKFILKKGVGTLHLPFFILFCYIGSFIYWMAASGSLFGTNATDLPFWQSLGISIEVFAGAFAFVFILSSWLNCIMRGAFKRNEINILLAKEKKYLEAVRSRVSMDTT